MISYITIYNYIFQDCKIKMTVPSLTLETVELTAEKVK